MPVVFHHDSNGRKRKHLAHPCRAERAGSGVGIQHASAKPSWNARGSPAAPGSESAGRGRDVEEGCGDGNTPPAFCSIAAHQHSAICKDRKIAVPGPGVLPETAGGRRKLVQGWQQHVVEKARGRPRRVRAATQLVVVEQLHTSGTGRPTFHQQEGASIGGLLTAHAAAGNGLFNCVFKQKVTTTCPYLQVPGTLSCCRFLVTAIDAWVAGWSGLLAAAAQRAYAVSESVREALRGPTLTSTRSSPTRVGRRTLPTVSGHASLKWLTTRLVHAGVVLPRVPARQGRLRLGLTNLGRKNVPKKWTTELDTSRKVRYNADRHEQYEASTAFRNSGKAAEE